MKKLILILISILPTISSLNAQDFQIYPNSANFLIFQIDESTWELESYTYLHKELCSNNCDSDSLPMDHISSDNKDFMFFSYRYIPSLDTIIYGISAFMAESQLYYPTEWYDANNLEYVYTKIDFPENPKFFIYDPETVQEYTDSAQIAWQQIESLEYIANLAYNPAGFYAGFIRYLTGVLPGPDAAFKWLIILYAGNNYSALESIDDLDFSIYPNPAREQIMISTNKTGKLKLYNITGKLILQETLYGKENAIDISGLHPGIIFAEICYADGTQITKKIIITK